MRILFSFLLALLISHPAALHGKKMTNLRIVVQNQEGDPVPRASLIVRTLKGKKLRKIGRSLELRTSQEGTAPLPPLPRKAVLIQVIAEGYQTFGDTVRLTELDQTVTITLKPPQKQHSVHTAQKEEE